MTFDLFQANENLLKFDKLPPVISQLKTGVTVEICRAFGPFRNDKHYIALLNGQEIGKARLYGIYLPFADFTGQTGVGHVSYVEVQHEHRRIGIATALHDVIEKDLKSLGAVLVAGDSLSEDAQAFWKDRVESITIYRN